jgi:hypothetical protein
MWCLGPGDPTHYAQRPMNLYIPKTPIELLGLVLYFVQSTNPKGV